jgi:uncharacterized protein (DUF433 family)
MATPLTSEPRERKVEQTGYPHVVRIEGVRGGRPVVEGTSLEIWVIVANYYQYQMSVEELITDWPHLTPAKIYGALTYYHDHQVAVDQEVYEHSEEYREQHHAPHPAE